MLEKGYAPYQAEKSVFGLVSCKCLFIDFHGVLFTAKDPGGKISEYYCFAFIGVIDILIIKEQRYKSNKEPYCSKNDCPEGIAQTKECEFKKLGGI
jgi:hypothetical protein